MAVRLGWKRRYACVHVLIGVVCIGNFYKPELLGRIVYLQTIQKVSLYVYVMPFFIIFSGIVNKILDAFVSGVLFTMPFCYTTLNSMRTMERMIHGVGACVVNALFVICPTKVVKICKIDKNRRKTTINNVKR